MLSDEEMLNSENARNIPVWKYCTTRGLRRNEQLTSSELIRQSFSGDVWLSYSVPIDVLSANI